MRTLCQILAKTDHGTFLIPLLKGLKENIIKGGFIATNLYRKLNRLLANGFLYYKTNENLYFLLNDSTALREQIEFGNFLT
jgi:hypothetical protein